jgi:hypothetical protein
MATETQHPVTPLPVTGFLRLQQIIGEPPVTKEQAEENKRKGKGYKRPRAGIPAIIPVGRSAWWAGVRSGRYPKSLKLSSGTTVWRVEDIRNLIESA